MPLHGCLVDVQPLHQFVADEIRCGAEHLARREQRRGLTVEPERSIIGLGVDAELPESFDLRFGGTREHLQPQVLDE